jgi:type IV fimbrial biogenesis protein FimT
MRKENGFTLIEMMVVIAIIGIITAIATGSFKRNETKLRDAASMIQADFERARSRAIRENAFVVVVINTNTDTHAYNIFIDNGTGGGTAQNLTRDGSETVLSDANLPAGIQIINTTFTGNKTGFNGRGYCLRNGLLTLYSSGKSVVVDMNNRFGRITISTP